MLKLKFFKIFLILVIFYFIFIEYSLKINAENLESELELELKIIYTNDIHGRINGDQDPETGKNIGLSRIASYIADTKLKNLNTVVIDAGDIFHGDIIANLSQGQAILKIINQIGYNYFVPGNHEFNFGKDRFIELTKNGNFKTICANLLNYDIPMFPENDIFEINGVKIGVFGLTSPDLITKNDPKKVEGLQVLDPLQIAKKQVQILKDRGANLIILIAHLGIQAPDTNLRSYAIRDYVPEIDLIIDSHSHNNLANIKQCKDKAPITSAGMYGQELGIVDIKIKNGKKEIKTYNLNLNDLKNICKNLEIEKIIEFENKKIESILKKKIGYTNVHLNGDREIIRKQPTNLAEITCAAILKETGAEIVFLNSGAFRSSINSGDITIGDVLRVFSLNHYIVTKHVSGNNIIKALDLAVKQYPTISAAFPQVSGITFEIVTLNGENKVQNVLINNKQIDLNRNYVLATNNFLCVGGDGFYMLRNDPSPYLKRYSPLDEIVIKYITEISPIS